MAPNLVIDAQAPISSVEASLNFAVRPEETPYAYIGDPPEGRAQTNVEHQGHVVRIDNARPVADGIGLDTTGFALVRHASAVRDFWDEAQTLALGHPETAELVKSLTGASRVVVFDHTLRRRGDAMPVNGPSLPRQPVGRVHVDQTVASGPRRIREIMGGQADALLARRAAIINVWRPIAHPARDWPLALGDARSFDANDLIATQQIFPHRTGETYGVAYSPAQHWYYVPDLALDEAILIKCWDSDAAVARFTPHTGFEDPTTPPGTLPRQSIELRTIAFFD